MVRSNVYLLPHLRHHMKFWGCKHENMLLFFYYRDCLTLFPLAFHHFHRYIFCGMNFSRHFFVLSQKAKLFSDFVQNKLVTLSAFFHYYYYYFCFLSMFSAFCPCSRLLQSVKTCTVFTSFPFVLFIGMMIWFYTSLNAKVYLIMKIWANLQCFHHHGLSVIFLATTKQF